MTEPPAAENDEIISEEFDLSIVLEREVNRAAEFEEKASVIQSAGGQQR